MNIELDNDKRINPIRGAIALGHPLEMSGARLTTSAFYRLQKSNSKYALCTMCIGVGQGISMVLGEGLIDLLNINYAIFSGCV